MATEEWCCDYSSIGAATGVMATEEWCCDYSSSGAATGVMATEEWCCDYSSTGAATGYWLLRNGAVTIVLLVQQLCTGYREMVL
jgi:hypothetical protein